jgi:hypothetical protein
MPDPPALGERRMVSTRLREDGVIPSSAANLCMSSICLVAIVSQGFVWMYPEGIFRIAGVSCSLCSASIHLA